MPLTVAAAQQVATMIDAAGTPMRNHKFAQFIRVKYHSVSTRQPWFRRLSATTWTFFQ
jgi:hypothetical protein